jgi:RNA polymerase sigma factor (sigma-70 family)
MRDQLWKRYPNVSDAADRDNVIEHTLRRVADHEARRGPAQNLRALIWRIFPQVVTSLLRKGRYRLRLDPLEDAEPKNLAIQNGSSEAIERRLIVAEILRASDDRTRKVLTLRYLAGFETDEVARMLGTSTENIRQIIHRAADKWRSRD